MADNLTLKRVLWRDGDVVSEDHFYALENWVEQLVGVANQHWGTFGMVRNATLDPEYNNNRNISFKQIQGTHFRVDIGQLQAINAFGRILRIDSPRTFDFHFKSAQRNPDGSYVLYLSPVTTTPDASQPSGSEVITGATMYDAGYELASANDGNAGVAICRFRYEENQIVPDAGYVPFGVFMDSTPMSAAAHENLLGKFQTWVSLLDRYVVTLKPSADMMVIWNGAWQLYRLGQYNKPRFEDRHAPTFAFFTGLQQFFGAVAAELKAISVGWPQATLQQRAAETIDLLGQPLYRLTGQQFDLVGAFANAEKAFDASVKILSYMPAGPITEKTIAIARAEVMKEAAGNRIVVHFEEESMFTPGKSRLTIQLREFSKADPVGGNVRVGLGLAIYAQLRDLRNYLKRVPGESFSYNIECPPETVTRDRASQLTMYVPPPLGEGVIDLKGHIAIIVKD